MDGKERIRTCLAIAGAAVVAAGLAPATSSARQTLVFGGVRWGKTTVAPRIYAVGVDGTGMRRLTSTPGVEDVAPAWRPDGRRIAFGRDGFSAGWRLYSMRPDGTDQRAITGRLSLASEPSWSPDGRRLAFAWMPSRPPSTFAQQIAVVSPTAGACAWSRPIRSSGEAARTRPGRPTARRFSSPGGSRCARAPWRMSGRCARTGAVCGG